MNAAAKAYIGQAAVGDRFLHGVQHGITACLAQAGFGLGDDEQGPAIRCEEAFLHPLVAPDAG